MYKYTLSVLIASAAAVSSFVFQAGCSDGETGGLPVVETKCDAGADAYHDPEIATCSDGIRNHGETGIDCGGIVGGVSVNDCPPCPAGEHCSTAADCASGSCDSGDPTTPLDDSCF